MLDSSVDMVRKGFVNLTPFAAEQLLLQDERGADVLTLVVKASFRIRERGGLERLEPQSPLNLAPVFHGEPGASSLKYETEAVFTKTTTDVVLLGHAHAPNDRTTQLEVSLRVGSLHKRVLVVGERVWSRFLGTSTISPPLRFERMPLVYERAFGGWDRSVPEQHEVDLRNPVGTGFIAHPSRHAYEGLRLPNLEEPSQPIRRPTDRPPPVGFGFIAPNWQPRLRHAGTYDRAWLEQHLPLVPQDFDRRHFNAAPVDQQAPTFFKGGEPVELLNASTRGHLRFNLPTHRFEGVVMMRPGRRDSFHMPLDTVLIDTDEHLLMMVWRGSFPIHRRVHALLWAKVQELGGGSRP